MAQQKSLANLSLELAKLKEDLNAYLNVNNTLKNTVGSTQAKGFAALTKGLWNQIDSYLNSLPDIFFGKSSTNPNKKAGSPKDYGLAYVSQVLADIDLCSLINTLQNFTKNSQTKTFDPSQDPPPDDPKWKIQYVAYEIQKYIDLFEAVYSKTSDPSTSISNVISQITPNLVKLTGADYLASNSIRKSYPQIDLFNNFILDKLKGFQTNQTILNSDKTAINNALKAITSIRQTCVLIQGLTSPASLVSYISNSVDSTTFKEINNLFSDNIDPKSLTKTISEIQSTAQSVDGILSYTVTKINQIREVIKIALIIVKVFKIVENFVEALPIPNMYTTSGITTTFAKLDSTLKQYSDDTIKVLDEINLILSIIAGIIEGISQAVDLVVANLKNIASKLDSCTRDSSISTISSSLKNTVLSIESSNQQLKDFATSLSVNIANNKITYYGYTIQILTEEISDKEVQKITIPRRYGIALSGDGIAVVETTPTYASNDEIIIQEVKLLLNEKNLVKSQASSLTSAQLDTINQSIAAIGGNSITFGDLPNDDPTAQMDPPDNQDDNSGLGVNAFFNKQKGGRQLRKRVNSILLNQKSKLSQDLTNVKK